MILSFRHKGLKEVFESGQTAKLNQKLQPKMLLILDALDQAKKPEDMNLPGLDFHALKGHKPTRWSVHVNGPWCVTFEFEGENAKRVDFEQYH